MQAWVKFKYDWYASTAEPPAEFTEISRNDGYLVIYK